MMTRTNQPWSPSRLYRDPDNGVMMGVCAGIADYFGIARWIVRVGAIVLLFAFTFMTVIVYFGLGLALKPKPLDLYANADEERFWRDARVDPKRTVGDLQSKYRAIEKRIRDAEAFVTSSEFKLRRDFRWL
jgi:phage shock protein C